MSPRDTGNLIRCDCSHTLAQHEDSGCVADPAACVCRKTPAAIVLEEIATLRPEWTSGEGGAGS